MTPPRLTVRHLSKRFGATQALDALDLEVAPGEVHAVVGENGAGKSTLMGIVAGALAADSGGLELDGAAFSPASPSAAQRAGVAIVHQEPMLCPHLSIAENVLLGAEPVRCGMVDRKRAELTARQALLTILPEAAQRDLAQPALSLSASERQLVAIARATVNSDCRLLILDEPTSSLTASDVEHLFGVIGTLKRRGVSIVYISHWLEELFRIADRYSVLRDGRRVALGQMDQTTETQLIGMMAGRNLARVFARSPRTSGEVLISVSHLAGERLPTDASLELRRGEVLGIAGLVGAGRSELLRVIFGLEAVRSGSLRVKHHAGPRSPALRWSQEVGFISEDRKSEGLAQGLSVATNLTLTRPPPARFSFDFKSSRLGRAAPRRARPGARRAWSWFVSLRQMQLVTEDWAKKLDIRCHDAWQTVAQLSGGNQQKVALARLLYHEADVFLLDEPTRGIDVHSRAFVYETIDQLAAQGKAVLMVSSYLPELMGLCDRVQVMRGGKLGPAHETRAVTEHELLAEAIGS